MPPSKKGQPSKESPVEVGGKPWAHPGPTKEAWKDVPGNRYTPEEVAEILRTTKIVFQKRKTAVL